jgi:hypothetical protein
MKVGPEDPDWGGGDSEIALHGPSDSPMVQEAKAARARAPKLRLPALGRAFCSVTGLMAQFVIWILILEGCAQAVPHRSIRAWLSRFKPVGTSEPEPEVAQAARGFNSPVTAGIAPGPSLSN